jgi:hypothetical protein
MRSRQPLYLRSSSGPVGSLPACVLREPARADRRRWVAPCVAFPSKRDALFRESNLHLNRELMQLERWDEEAITQRGRRMFDIALRV